ncbi:MAG TPA: hypothetical protein PKO06_22370 [Candidatus Ozemobacteraceae bacterium]|nr:hypothetical protein [Candidatus Ozemobacteraceae bacterium]
MNKHLFSTSPGEFTPPADCINEAGGLAYALPPHQALAQLAATGCLGHTYYATAETQLSQVLELCKLVEPEFVARVAVYGRNRGYMKDMPALLCAWLTTVDLELAKKVFERVIDSGKMLRNFVQVMRSGVIGRKSLGTAPRRFVREWFRQRDDDTIFRQSVGQSPSLGDIVKMVHPRPETKARAALFAWLAGLKHDSQELSGLAREYELYKTGKADG